MGIRTELAIDDSHFILCRDSRVGLDFNPKVVEERSFFQRAATAAQGAKIKPEGEIEIGGGFKDDFRIAADVDKGAEVKVEIKWNLE